MEITYQVLKVNKVINDLKNIFELSEDDLTNGFFKENKFFINKNYKSRFEVISLLQDYFHDKVFEKGYGLKISPITLVFTGFKIIELPKL